jgi:AraC-like DNA-binding protein
MTWKNINIEVFTTVLILLLSNSYLFGNVTFIIEALPNTTPPNDSIFICGTFNNWNVNDKNYLLHRQIDGKYAIEIAIDSAFFEYKFTRGSWMKVETNEINEYLENRKYENPEVKTVYITIVNWQDLGGVKKFNYIILYLFAMAFYGFAVLFQLFRLPKKDILKLRMYVIYNGLLILLLIVGVWHNQSNLIWQSLIKMVGLVFLFGWGSIHLIFVRVIVLKKFKSNWLFNFIPSFLILLIILSRLCNYTLLNIFTIDINPYLNVGDTLAVLVGIVIVLSYHVRILYKLNYTNQFEIDDSELGLLKRITLINIVGIFSIPINIVLLYQHRYYPILQGNTLLLVILSITILLQFYYFWKYPEIMKVKNIQIPFEIANEMKLRIELLMETKKPFKECDLNVAELAEILNTKPYILSKIINEHYKKNFRDFINDFRVQEFIKLAQSESYKNYTFLALAHEVGFNSKSTFNLAFKKTTQKSPREFLKDKKLNIKGL